jgi:cation transport ATPase
MADRYAGFFLPVTLLVAGLAWGLSGDPVRALAVVVVATPCPLILAAPIALVSGLSRAARAGVIVKGAGAIETLGDARTVLFDKTGTLTVGTPEVRNIVTRHGWEPGELLRLAASVDRLSAHVLGDALVAAAMDAQLDLTMPADVHEEPGQGIEGSVDGHRSLALGQELAGAVIGLMWTGGAALEAIASQRARRELTALVQRAPKLAQLRVDDRLEEVPVEQVPVGDVVLVRTGEVVAVDGTVISPEAVVDTSALSGEPLPEAIRRGMPVLSGSANAGAPFDVRADRPASDSAYAALERRSPEIIATCRTPSALRCSTIFSASGRSSSAITMTPATCPSIATTTCASPDPWVAVDAAATISSCGAPLLRANARLPTATRARRPPAGRGPRLCRAIPRG